MTVNGIVSFFISRYPEGKGRWWSIPQPIFPGRRFLTSYYDKIHDYTSKSGVIFTEILTPEYVPERLTDRETLWNEVEHGKGTTRHSLPIRLTLHCRMN